MFFTPFPVAVAIITRLAPPWQVQRSVRSVNYGAKRENVLGYVGIKEKHVLVNVGIFFSLAYILLPCLIECLTNLNPSNT